MWNSLKEAEHVLDFNVSNFTRTRAKCMKRSLSPILQLCYWRMEKEFSDIPLTTFGLGVVI
jgi:hypothetical protein